MNKIGSVIFLLEEILINNVDRKNFALWFILITIISIIILFIIIILINYFQIKKERIKNSINFKNERVFVINYKNADIVVDYFDTNNLRKINTISFFDFLNLFPDSDQNDIKTYINTLFNFDYGLEDKESTLITNIILNTHKRKTVYRVILKCNGIDREKKILYLSCIKLTHTPVDHRGTKKNLKHDVYDSNEIKKMYDEGKFSKGILCIFRFYVKPNTISFYNEFLIERKAIDYLYSKLNNSVSYIYIDKDNFEFSILDLRYFNEYQLEKYSNELYQIIEKYLEVTGLYETYYFRICSGHVVDLPTNYDSAYNVMSDLFVSANEINRSVSIYDKKKNEISILESTYKLEIKKIIKNKEFSVNFAPIVRLTKSRVTTQAYLSSVDFDSKIILNKDDIFKSSITFNLSQQLISIIFRQIIPNFLSQTANLSYKLIIPIPYNLLDVAIDVIKHIQDGDKANIVFSIPSVDLIDLEESNSLVSKLSDVRRQGFDLALYTKTCDYVLKRATYKLFDYCLIDPMLEANVKQVSRSYIKFKAVYDKINKSVPVIALNAKSFQSMELLSQIGIKDFSNDFIAKKSPMLLPLNTKVIKKMVDISK